MSSINREPTVHYVLKILKPTNKPKVKKEKEKRSQTNDRFKRFQSFNRTINTYICYVINRFKHTLHRAGTRLVMNNVYVQYMIGWVHKIGFILGFCLGL